MRLPLALIFALVAVAPACGEDADGPGVVDLSPPFGCRERPDDGTGYLLPICQHIVDERGEYAIDPNTLAIISVTAGDQEPGAPPPTNSADVDHVRLSCCFTGDSAVMDRATRTVLSFSLGDQ